MIRRKPWRMLVLAVLCLVPAGCESLHSWLHKDGDDKLAVSDKDDSSTGKIIGGSSDDKSPSSFFKNNRTSGGWSSEAREIESHLGAN